MKGVIALFLTIGFISAFKTKAWSYPSKRGSRAPPLAKNLRCETRAFSPSSKSRLPYSFQDPALKKQALTRRIINRGGLDSERLEFLGDTVFNMLMLDLLLARYPNVDKSLIHKKWESVVNRRAQAQLAGFLRLDREIIFLDKKVPRLNQQVKILSDVLESLIGAVYLDGGYRATKLIIARFFDSMKKEGIVDDWNYQQEFDQIIFRQFQQLPEYEIKIKEDLNKPGKKGQSVFLVRAKVGEQILGEGTAPDHMSIATQISAKDGLRRLGVLDSLFQVQADDPLAKMPFPAIEAIDHLPYFYYQKIKFLGHAVLNMAIADILIEQYPRMREGRLSSHKDGLLDFIKKNHLPNKDLESRIAQLQSQSYYGKDSHFDNFQGFLGVQYLEEGYRSAKNSVFDFFKEFAKKS